MTPRIQAASMPPASPLKRLPATERDELLSPRKSSAMITAAGCWNSCAASYLECRPAAGWQTTTSSRIPYQASGAHSPSSGTYPCSLSPSLWSYRGRARRRGRPRHVDAPRVCATPLPLHRNRGTTCSPRRSNKEASRFRRESTSLLEPYPDLALPKHSRRIPGALPRSNAHEGWLAMHRRELPPTPPTLLGAWLVTYREKSMAGVGDGWWWWVLGIDVMIDYPLAAHARWCFRD